jgi:hypothetical protein
VLKIARQASSLIHSSESRAQSAPASLLGGCRAKLAGEEASPCGSSELSIYSLEDGSCTAQRKKLHPNQGEVVYEWQRIIWHGWANGTITMVAEALHKIAVNNNGIHGFAEFSDITLLER